MKSATISQAKNHLSELLARVKRGESVLILERDRPIARLVPIAAGGTDDARLAELERRGAIRRAPQGPMKKLPPPIEWPKGADVTGALLLQRKQSRY